MLVCSNLLFLSPAPIRILLLERQFASACGNKFVFDGIHLKFVIGRTILCRKVLLGFEFISERYIVNKLSRLLAGRANQNIHFLRCSGTREIARPFLSLSST